MIYKEEAAVIRPTMPQGVGACFTYRTGGVSSGPWGGVDGIMGLNVGSHVGDNAGCVRMNRQMIAGMVPGTVRWLTQVHGTRVADAETLTDDCSEADASVSLTPGVVCVVQVADCLPVLIADTQGRAVAAVHAGWRSLVGGVIEKTVEHMRARLQDPQAQFQAWLGPRIGFDDFETSSETIAQFKKVYPEVLDGVKDCSTDHGKLSLALYAQAALKRVNVETSEDCGLSTVADPVHFYSYRRDGEKTGRHAALIWIED